MTFLQKDIQTANKYLKRCSASLALGEELMETTDGTSQLLGCIQSRNGKWQILEEMLEKATACALLVGLEFEQWLWTCLAVAQVYTQPGPAVFPGAHETQLKPGTRQTPAHPCWNSQVDSTGVHQ